MQGMDRLLNAISYGKAMELSSVGYVLSISSSFELKISYQYILFLIIV